MIDIDGTLHSIATTAEAAVIGGLNESGGTITKSDKIGVYDTRTSGWSTPHPIVHEPKYVWLGPFIKSKLVNITISLSGLWRIERKSGAVENYSGLQSSSKIAYGSVVSSGSTVFSGPYWDKSIFHDSTFETGYTFPNEYIMVRWENDAIILLKEGVSTENINYSTLEARIYITVTQEQSGRTYGNNKCIIKSELPTYNCKLKNPVPSDTNYANNQIVEWYDIGRADCTVTFYNEGTLVETRTISVGGTLGTLPTSPTKTGYTFNGWKDSDGNTASASTVINNDTRYDADYTINTYTLTYYPTDSDVSTDDEKSTMGTVTVEITTI